MFSQNQTFTATGGTDITFGLINFDGNQLTLDNSSRFSITYNPTTVVLTALASTKSPANFDSDNKADIPFWRPFLGEWYVQRSEDNSFFSFPFGTSGDIPAPGDYDGDGKFDASVFRPSNATWFVQNSNGSRATIVGFGANSDIPVPAALIP